MSAYDKAFKIKQKLEDERDWRMGQYNMSAFNVALGRAFGNNTEYIDKPILQAIEFENKTADEKLEIQMKAFVGSFAGTDLPPTIINDNKKGD